MRRLGLAIVLVALSSTLGVPTAFAATRSAFEGAWSSTDPVDGSTQHLYIQGGGSVQVFYVDDYGTTCAEIGASTTASQESAGDWVAMSLAATSVRVTPISAEGLSRGLR